ncbi:MAG: DUF349 domain-containing protein [Bacteroidales bacterium]|jgi:hypothetical protein|nr:DUF349 domain-containing protein [Bacteroidales bacterium]MCI2121604.1 DUF349 domain-containing protein [Bacteroidales bacterium]MCI2144717.1 DUF349 domain-containing protein [Bacteroidales bacterium]
MSDEIKNAASQEQQTPAEGQIGGQQTSESQVADKVAEVFDMASKTLGKAKEAAIEIEEEARDNAKSLIDKAEPIIDYSSKSLKELVDIFQKLIDSKDQQQLYKHAEMIKAAFYKVLKREKIACGYVAKPESEAIQKTSGEGEPETESEAQVVSTNPFEEVERGFKTLYQQYKTMRSAYLAESEKHKEENLIRKEEVIEKLKALVEKQEDVNRTFPEFRELQAEWRSIGPVPPVKFESLNSTYQLYVEKFYDYVRINRELRDLDFKKNLEAKTKLCEDAEALENENNVVDAFHKLQKLHEQWKELGPVDRENRESIWERFRKATAVINKKHQAYFDTLKIQQKENLEKKTGLCEKVETIANTEIKDPSLWNTFSKDIEEIQKEWKKIGFASKKENQNIYDRFRAACDKFFNAKRDYYGEFKSEMEENYGKKVDICEKAEAMKDSEDWKKTTEDLIELQKQWKGIGPVARKYSEQIWKRFRAACDAFFEERDKHFGSQSKEYSDNLTVKKDLIRKVREYELGDDVNADAEALKEIQQQWNSVGFVPYKEKERIQREFKEAMDEKFDAIRGAGGDDSQIRKFNNRYSGNRDQRYGRGGTFPPRTERDRLYQKYLKEQQEIQTYENNMGFFSKSKNADAILAGLNVKIEAAKEELAKTEQQIKDLDVAEASKHEGDQPSEEN